MKISDLDQPRIGDIVEFETDPETVVEGVIVGETEDGYIYEFSESGYTELHEACTYGKYYCSTDKMYKCRKGPKQSRTTEAANAAQQAAIAIAKKKKLKEFAPVGGDDREPNEEEILRQLAAMWWLGSEQQMAKAQRTLAAMGWEIGQDESGDDDAGVFVVRAGDENGDSYIAFNHSDLELNEEKQRLDPKCWDGYKKAGTKMKGGVRVNNCIPESSGYIPRNSQEAQDPRWSSALTGDVTTRTMRDQIGKFFPTDAPNDGQEQIREAEYHGREVPLGRPMQGDVKKFKVYVKDPSTGNVKKVNFGDPNMRIKKSNPARRKSFRARHNCANPGPRTKARYWSCRKW